jgi:O-antigen ligase
MAARIDTGRWLSAVGMALVAAPIGVLAGFDPRLAIVVAVAFAFILIAFGDLAAGVAFFALIGFLEIVPLFGPVLNLTKLAGVLLALSWLALLATRSDARLDFVAVHPYVATAIGLFVGWATLSTVWAENTDAALTSVSRYALNLILFLIVFTAVRNRRDLRLVLLGFVIGAGIAGIWGIASPSAEDPGRLATGAFDPNELAAVLVSGVALSVAVIAITRGQPLVRLLAAGIGIFCAGGVWLTASRGGLIALGAALLAAILISGRWRPQVAVVAIAFAAVSYVYFAGFAPADVQERISEPTSGQARLQEGRTTIWQVAWRVVEANPAQGVGAGNFETSSKHYVLQPGTLTRTDQILNEPKVAHNSFLEVFSELGAVGVGLFLLIVVFSIASLLLAARIFNRIEDRRMQAVALCLAVALLGNLAAGFLLSGQYSKQLWLLLGLGPAVLSMARASETSGLMRSAD